MKLYYAQSFGGKYRWIRFRTKDDGPQYAWSYKQARELLMRQNLFVKETDDAQQ